MLTLSIDTSTLGVSVGLVSTDGRVCLESSDLTGNPGEVTLPLIDRLLRSAGVDRSTVSHVAVGVGPGPYTSMRTGVMVAVTIAHTLGIPVAGVCSHDVIAAEVIARDLNDAEFGVATDARRREVYWATYDAAGVRTDGPHVSAPSVMLAAAPNLRWAGNGLDRYPELVADAGLERFPVLTPSAIVLAQLAAAAWQAGEQPGSELPTLIEHGSDTTTGTGIQGLLRPAYPLYLRRPDAKAPKIVAGSA